MRTLLRLLLLLGAAPAAAGAQFVSRPWLDWRTAETGHFAVHYPAEYREWTLATVGRLEAARDIVGEIVGWAPERVQVVIDDPVNAPNGFALPLLDRPTMVFFPVPPTPRQAIGNSRDWGELLAVHEYAHLAHLSRPSRRRFEFGRLLPTPVSPIARNSPRWAIEGFATYVEGRVTGSGRPHNAQRAAVLRQWALEGRLPSYPQMNASAAYYGGAFAYLMGSAYLEWLAAREGDSTITHLWRRMTARTPRGFTEAFTGVYGLGPDVLHGRFIAELTRDAFAVERAIDSLGGVVAGELVQRLSWETGDPALSPDGSRVALVLRSATRPGRVIVWRTGPDSIPPRVAAARDSARARARRRDPEDVPDRRILPPRKQTVAVLEARDGRPFDAPRYMPDGRHVLVSHPEPIGGGAFRPDLHVWDTKSGATRRVTHGAAVRQADPAPDGRTAVAVQCRRGWCDLVRIDLASGQVTVLREGSPSVSYYRPRVSPAGDRIAVAVQQDDRWRIVLVDPDDPTRADELLRDDRANRFDAAWADSGRTIVLVSEAGGIANLERVTVATGAAAPITRVTGSAFAPAVHPRTGEIWFLSLHARGLDARRLDANPPAVELPRTDTALFPVVPARPVEPPPLAIDSTVMDRPYGFGPRPTRWFPGLTAEPSAVTAQLLLVNSDPVGRLELALLGSLGSPAGWRGGRAWATLRRWRPTLTGEVFAATQRPLQLDGARPPAFDAQLAGGALRAEARVDRSPWRGGLAVGGSAMRLDGEAAAGGRASRTVGWLGADLSASRRVLGTTLGVAARMHGDAGHHGAGGVRHLAGAASLLLDLPLVPPLRASVTRVEDESAEDARFERAAIGGAASPLLDGALLPHRIAMPALPAGTLVGRSATAARVEVGPEGLRPYYWTGRVADDAYGGWHRVAGAELRFASDALPIATIPSVEILTGAGHSLDRPYKGRTTVYVSVTYRP